MKYLFIFIALCGSVPSLAQQKTEEKLFSRFLQADVYYTVYTPAGRDTAQPLPVLYTFSYGMVSGDYIAASLNYYQSAHYPIPNTIYVNVIAAMDRIGYSYSSGLLTKSGEQLVQCMQQEIFPAVEKKYHASSFRTYLGHSYAASYANYLFLFYPDLFRGYIVLAPEKIAAAQPPFVITDSLVKWYNQHTTFYYTAVGENDMERRMAYAKEAESKTKVFDSTRFYFRRDSIVGGDHTNIISLALQSGIEHVYQLYNPYEEAGKTDHVMVELQQVTVRVQQAYDMPPQKTPEYYSRFAQLAIANKDTAGLRKILAHFDNEKGKSWYYMQFAGFCSNLSMTALAYTYLGRAIAMMEKDEMNTDLGVSNLVSCYTMMANNILKDDNARAWQYLQKAKALSARKMRSGHQLIDIYYDMGVFAASHNYNVKEGLESLQQFIVLSGNVSADAHGLEYRKTNFYIGKCYYLLNDHANAKVYLQKELALHPGNKDATELLGKMK
ncbi:MAG: hypothetical protein QM731_05620 [Chitinophagaceae bacterium]